MYSCPNCAANLKFDISRQALFCEACETVLDPYSVVKEQDAEVQQYFEVTTFTCPQCGGEIISEDNEAAAFCSFCGGSTILDSRISKARRPFFIIPFKKTKKDCVESYKKMVGSDIFASDEVRNEKNIESFRGIYMPYWTYRYEKNGIVSVSATKSYQRGNYRYTEHHKLTGNLESKYDNISFDASSSFADNLSNAIAPFDQSQQLPFTPSFLSGFYADASDVGNDVYISDGRELVADDMSRKLKMTQPFSKYATKEKEIRSELLPQCTNGKLCMFPVWFMSLRTKGKNGEDRVSYAVVNGQTGRAAGDIPISMKKYTLISAGFGLLLFLILNFVFNLTISPKTSGLVATIMCVVMGIVFKNRETEINRRSIGADDKGIMSVSDEGLAVTKVNAANTLKKMKKQKTFFWIPVAVTALTDLINPVDDFWYYFSAILALAFVVLLIIRIVGRFNELTTRKLPQFNRTGGDDSASNL